MQMYILGGIVLNILDCSMKSLKFIETLDVFFLFFFVVYIFWFQNVSDVVNVKYVCLQYREKEVRLELYVCGFFKVYMMVGSNYQMNVNDGFSGTIYIKMV
eukprot:TRINITY_DN75031_c0_g2_i3.p7 TRINITY_DN75031_c0_g2~~TRINITY_DN75031_c0_g2_i3.p7  ORF type:complete len:101 (-),score=10.99 TRINITY_DN75031_c0_g2_i3:30-332(-)